MNLNLRGKAALVTGSSRGIGRAIALKLAREGAKVAVHCRENLEAAKAVAREISDWGGQAIVLSGDVASSVQAHTIVSSVIEAWGRLDIMVNNAAIIRDVPLAGMEDGEWSKVLDVNLTGTFNLCRAAARPMMQQKSGRILNISSFVARSGSRGQANYAASKGGIEALTRALAVELAGRNITVNAVAPGAVETDMSRETINTHKEMLLSRIPLKRLGKPEEVAALVAFLATDEAGYITGEVIGVTGGLGLWGTV